MRIDSRKYLRALIILVLLDALAFVVVFAGRPALSEEQWRFLESQRPTSQKFVACADCLNFAVFRREIGGWEGLPAALLQVANLPAFLAAVMAFSSLQFGASSSSQENSDLATLVLVCVAAAECAVLALPLGIRRSHTPSAA